MTPVSSIEFEGQEPPWYKQFWPWFLISLPAAAVVACAFTIYLAATHKDALVTDQYYRMGVTINAALAEMALAEKLGVAAQLEPVRDHRVLLHLPLTAVPAVGAFSDARPEELQLTLRHPTLPEKDFTVRLLPQGDRRYSGSFGNATGGTEAAASGTIDGRWMVVLSPGANATPRWRLEGTWRDPHQQGLQLGKVGATDAAAHEASVTEGQHPRTTPPS